MFACVFTHNNTVTELTLVHTVVGLPSYNAK